MYLRSGLLSSLFHFSIGLLHDGQTLAVTVKVVVVMVVLPSLHPPSPSRHHRCLFVVALIPFILPCLLPAPIANNFLITHLFWSLVNGWLLDCGRLVWFYLMVVVVVGGNGAAPL